MEVVRRFGAFNECVDTTGESTYYELVLAKTPGTRMAKLFIVHARGHFEDYTVLNYFYLDTISAKRLFLDLRNYLYDDSRFVMPSYPQNPQHKPNLNYDLKQIIGYNDFRDPRYLLTVIKWDGAPVTIDFRRWRRGRKSGNMKPDISPDKGFNMSDLQARRLAEALTCYFKDRDPKCEFNIMSTIPYMNFFSFKDSGSLMAYVRDEDEYFRILDELKDETRAEEKAKEASIEHHDKWVLPSFAAAEF